MRQCPNNLHQIAVALQAYHQANGCFPPAYIADKNGKPMHSWRVLILPYMDQDALYKTYDFTATLGRAEEQEATRHSPLRVYVCPSDPNVRAPGAHPDQLCCRSGTERRLGRREAEEAHGFRQGCVPHDHVVEVTNSGISWAEPRDLSLDTLGAADGKSPALALTSDHGRREEFFFTYDYVSGVNVAMADGSVRFLRTGNRSPEDLRKILQIGGFKEEEIGSQGDFYGGRRRLNWPNIAALAVWLLSVGTLLTHAVRSRKQLSVPPTPAAS